jgi:hypothetical protein
MPTCRQISLNLVMTTPDNLFTIDYNGPDRNIIRFKGFHSESAESVEDFIGYLF